MTAAVVAVGRRGGRSLLIGSAVGVVTALLLAALLLSYDVLPSRSAAPQPAAAGTLLAERQAAIVRWEEAVQPLVLSGGQVVARGPRTGIGDIERGTFPTLVLQDMASGWVRRLSALDQQIGAVSTPDFLRPAHALLGEAMEGYVTASQNLLAATTATGAQQTQLLEDAAAAGNSADAIYDKATAAIAAWRAQLNLPTDWSSS